MRRRPSKRHHGRNGFDDGLDDGLGLLGWVLIIGLLAVVVAVVLQILGRGGPRG